MKSNFAKNAWRRRFMRKTIFTNLKSSFVKKCLTSTIFGNETYIFSTECKLEITNPFHKNCHWLRCQQTQAAKFKIRNSWSMPQDLKSLTVSGKCLARSLGFFRIRDWWFFFSPFVFLHCPKVKQIVDDDHLESLAFFLLRLSNFFLFFEFPLRFCFFLCITFC